MGRTRRSACSATPTTNPSEVWRPNGTRTGVPGTIRDCRARGIPNVKTRSPARSGTLRATSAN